VPPTLSLLVEAGTDLWVDESLESLRERAQEREKGADVGSVASPSLEVPSPESVTYVDYDNPFAFIGESCGTAPIVHRLSPLAWVSVGREIYILECLGAGFIRVDPSTDPEGDSSTLSHTSRHLIWGTRTGSQVPSALYPGYVGQRHSKDAQTLAIPASPSHHASTESRTGYQGL
jgi:hypothetical protein